MANSYLPSHFGTPMPTSYPGVAAQPWSSSDNYSPYARQQYAVNEPHLMEESDDHEGDR